MKKFIMFVMAVGMCFALSSCAWLENVDSSSTGSEVVVTKTVTVIFRQNGAEDVVKTVKEGDALTDIPTPAAKTGYTVVWEEADLTNITEDMVVNAVEMAKTYTVTLNANGGEVSQETFTVTYDAEYTLVEPTHDEYGFKYWTYAGNKVDLSGIWNIDSENGEIQLLAEWGGSNWSYSY